MRTIRFEYKLKLDAISEANVQTEVIVDDDEEAEQAGRDAAEVIRSFIRDIGELGDEVKRISNAKELKKALLREPSCVLCGRPSAHAHHVLFRSQQGDDVKPNLVGVCLRCHERIHGEDRVTRAALGNYILEHRWDTIGYLEHKLGEQWRDWFHRRLCVKITIGEEASV